MMKYKISFTVEFDQNYADSEQLEALRDEISMVIADYNCFLETGGVKIEEVDSRFDSRHNFDIQRKIHVQANGNI